MNLSIFFYRYQSLWGSDTIKYEIIKLDITFKQPLKFFSIPPCGMSINGVPAMQREKTPGLLFRRARVIDPKNNTDRTADVLVMEGTLREISPRIKVTADQQGAAGIREIDLQGKWVTPGLVDMHVHLREPGEEYKETIQSGTRAAVAGGYVAVACMPNTKPVNDCAAVTQFITRHAREEGACHVFPVASITRGLAGEDLTEMAELKEAGAVAVSDDGRPVMNSMVMRRALEYSRTFDLLVISHAEDLHLSEGGLMNEGPTSTLLGLKGIPAAAEEIMIARDILLARLTGASIHIAHVSTEGAVRLIREAKKQGIPVTAEAAPHHFTLTDEALMDFNTVFKVNPPIRGTGDVEAVKAGLADGTLDAVATDHAPHSVLEKDTEFEYAANGVIGLESALPLTLGLVTQGILSPMEAVAKLSTNPARILSVPLGSLEVGKPANLTVIDPDASYILDVESFQSRSRNCPFHGWEVRGRALMTVVDGRIAFTRMDL